MDHEIQLRQQLAKMIDWNEAHTDFSATVSGFPAQAARACAGRIPALWLAIAGAHTYRIVGHGGIQPERQT